MLRILVCVKPVPAEREVSLDERGVMARERVGLQLNIADEAALEAALSVEAEREITVLTMGTPAAEAILSELLQRGVDRALLISDKRFAGADTFATAVTLAAAIRRLGGFDLILCGRRAMDGETGQVPGMLGALLDIPCCTNASEVNCSEESVGILRTSETTEETITLKQPAIVSVCEYSYSLRRPSIRGMRAALNKKVGMLSFEELGLDEEAVGYEGSLTNVVSSKALSIGRRRCTKVKASDEAFEMLLHMIEEAGGRRAYHDGSADTGHKFLSVSELRKMQKILVLWDEYEDCGLLCRALSFDEQLKGGLTVISLKDCLELTACDLDVAKTLAGYIDKLGRPEMILAPATVRLRNIMPNLAALLKAGLTADCTDLALDPDGRLLQKRPAFGNGLIAEIRSKSDLQMATVRPGVFACTKEAELPKDIYYMAGGALAENNERVSMKKQNVSKARISIPSADIILSCGAGTGSRENFDRLGIVADRYGIAMGASRQAVYDRIATYPYQIGQTGMAVHPKLYIAAGISGAVQHLVGMNGSEKVVAINKDEHAPIFDYADLGIVGDIRELTAFFERIAAD